MQNRIKKYFVQLLILILMSVSLRSAMPGSSFSNVKEELKLSSADYILPVQATGDFKKFEKSISSFKLSEQITDQHKSEFKTQRLFISEFAKDLQTEIHFKTHFSFQLTTQA